MGINEQILRRNIICRSNESTRGKVGLRKSGTTGIEKK